MPNSRSVSVYKGKASAFFFVFGGVDDDAVAVATSTGGAKERVACRKTAFARFALPAATRAPTSRKDMQGAQMSVPADGSGEHKENGEDDLVTRTRAFCTSFRDLLVEDATLAPPSSLLDVPRSEQWGVWAAYVDASSRIRPLLECAVNLEQQQQCADSAVSMMLDDALLFATGPVRTQAIDEWQEVYDTTGAPYVACCSVDATLCDDVITIPFFWPSRLQRAQERAQDATLPAALADNAREACVALEALRAVDVLTPQWLQRELAFARWQMQVESTALDVVANLIPSCEVDGEELTVASRATYFDAWATTAETCALFAGVECELGKRAHRLLAAIHKLRNLNAETPEERGEWLWATILPTIVAAAPVPTPPTSRSPSPTSSPAPVRPDTFAVAAALASMFVRVAPDLAFRPMASSSDASGSGGDDAIAWRAQLLDTRRGAPKSRRPIIDTLLMCVEFYRQEGEPVPSYK
jgi:hypothetical protein